MSSSSHRWLASPYQTINSGEDEGEKCHLKASGNVIVSYLPLSTKILFPSRLYPTSTSRPSPSHSQYYNQLGCAGTPIQVLGNYLNCIVSPDKTISYAVTCLNASAFEVNYFTGNLCSGTSIHSADVGWDSDCQGTPDGKATVTKVCNAGKYTVPTKAVNQYFYSDPSICPIESDARYTGVVSIPFACQSGTTSSGASQGLIYGCDKTTQNITVTVYETRDCTGPSSAPIAVGALGCTSAGGTSGATYAMCGGMPPPSKSLRASSSSSSLASALTVTPDRITEAIANGLIEATKIAMVNFKEQPRSGKRV